MMTARCSLAFRQGCRGGAGRTPISAAPGRGTRCTVSGRQRPLAGLQAVTPGFGDSWKETIRLGHRACRSEHSRPHRLEVALDPGCGKTRPSTCIAQQSARRTFPPIRRIQHAAPLRHKSIHCRYGTTFSHSFRRKQTARLVRFLEFRTGGTHVLTMRVLIVSRSRIFLASGLNRGCNPTKQP